MWGNELSSGRSCWVWFRVRSKEKASVYSSSSRWGLKTVEMLIWEIRHRRRTLPLLWWTKNPLVFFLSPWLCSGDVHWSSIFKTVFQNSHPVRSLPWNKELSSTCSLYSHTCTCSGGTASPRGGRKNPHQCQKKDEHSSSVGASVALLIFLIEFIYLSSFNNLRCSTQWYANELFKFNEFLMTRQIISRARCGVHVIWGGINWSALLNVWVQTA